MRPLRQLYFLVDEFLLQTFPSEVAAGFRELLGRDYAQHERVVNGSAPDFFNTELTVDEYEAVRLQVKQQAAKLERDGKLQYFAAVFESLAECSGRQVLLFLYLSRSGRRREVRELRLEMD